MLVSTMFLGCLSQQAHERAMEELEMASQKLTIVRVPEVALELISQLNYDVVLIDIDLPTTNGLELYGNMKKVNPSISAILICNNDDSSIKLAEESVRQKAYTYLLKPLESEEAKEEASNNEAEEG